MSTQRISPGPVLIPAGAAGDDVALRILPAKKSRSSAAKTRPAKKASSRNNKTASRAKKMSAAKSKTKNTLSTRKLEARTIFDSPRILLANDAEPQPMLVLGPEGDPPPDAPAPVREFVEIAATEFVVPAEPIAFEAAPLAAEPILDQENVVPARAEMSKLDSVATARTTEDEQPEKIESSPEGGANWTAILRILAAAWNWLQDRFKTRQGRKRLRVCETVSLGEKRFVAVIQVDGEQFLVGGASNSVSTLARLTGSREFVDILQSRCEQDVSQA